MDNDSVLVVSPQVGVTYPFGADDGEVGARILVDTISAASVDVISHATEGFTEIRSEASASASRRWGRFLPQVNARFSREPDYRSISGGLGSEARLSGDTTLSLSGVATFDTVGASGTPFSEWSDSLRTILAEGSVTQNLGVRTVLRGVYSLTVQDGYMEKRKHYERTAS